MGRPHNLLFVSLVALVVWVVNVPPAVAEPEKQVQRSPAVTETASTDNRGSVAPQASPPKSEPATTPAAKPPPGKAKNAPAPARRKTKRKRKGKLNPCMTPDPGWGIYDKWSRNISMGQMLAPQRGGLTPRGSFDLLVHFHGHYPVRKEFVKTARGTVLVAIDLGTSSGPYSQAFASQHTFKKLIASVEREMARRSGRKRTQVRKLGLSSWSAGYGAVAQILRQPAGRKVDALILLDSVHTGYSDNGKTLQTVGLAPFIKFARQAARGRKFMFQSHSSIIPPGYASTREVSQYIVGKLSGKLRKARRSDVLGLRLFERFDRRGYHARGYRGKDKPDHCAHLGLMKDVMKVHINPRWRSPRGRTGKLRLSKKKTQALRSGRLHVVRSGEHLTGIAKSYGTTVQALREANDLKRNAPLLIGQELLVPKTAKKKPGQKSAAKKDRKRVRIPKGAKLHTVHDGQFLGSIARRYNVSVADILEANDLAADAPIRPGQKLIIPKRK